MYRAAREPGQRVRNSQTYVSQAAGSEASRSSQASLYCIFTFSSTAGTRIACRKWPRSVTKKGRLFLSLEMDGDRDIRLYIAVLFGRWSWASVCFPSFPNVFWPLKHLTRSTSSRAAGSGLMLPQGSKELHARWTTLEAINLEDTTETHTTATLQGVPKQQVFNRL